MHSPEELDRAAQGLAEAAATARESDRPSRRTEREAES
jgi:hypothetical protein